MKIAFLADVHSPDLESFQSKIEEAINSVGGRLIYMVKSRNPIRLVCVEDFISSSASRGSSNESPESVIRPGVKNATGTGISTERKGNAQRPQSNAPSKRRTSDGTRNGCGTLDQLDYRGNRPPDCRRGSDADISECIGGLQRNGRHDWTRPRCIGPGAHRSRHLAGLCLRIPSVARWKGKVEYHQTQGILFPGYTYFSGA